MRRACAIAVVVGALAGTVGPASAEPSDGSFALEGAFGIGAVTHGRSFAAFELIERIHIGYRLPWGLQGGLAINHAGALGGDVDHSAELILFGPEVRYHPFGDACVDPWLGFTAGFGNLDEEGDSPWRREKWSGGAFQATVGVLFAVTQQMAVGAWAGASFGLWEQTCILDNPYQLEHCIGHGGPRMFAVGASVAPRFAPPPPPSAEPAPPAETGPRARR